MYEEFWSFIYRIRAKVALIMIAYASYQYAHTIELDLFPEWLCEEEEDSWDRFDRIAKECDQDDKEDDDWLPTEIDWAW